jgi:hypothetical protein
VPFTRYRPNTSDSFPLRDDRQEAQANDGIRKQSTANKIIITSGYHVIETKNTLVKLGTDSAHECIPVRWHLPQEQSWAILDSFIRLG